MQQDYSTFNLSIKTIQLLFAMCLLACSKTVFSYTIVEVIPGQLYTLDRPLHDKDRNKMFVGFEVLTNERGKAWRNYNSTSSYATLNFYYNDEIYNNEEFFDIHNGYGFDPEEFNQLKSKFLRLKNKFPGRNFVSEPLAVSSFFSDTNDTVTYFSKEPITDLLAHEITAVELHREKNFKKYHDNYQNLIMAVSSAKDASDRKAQLHKAYESIGIHRTQQSFLNGDYRGISMKMHGCNAVYFRETHGKTIIFINALYSMAAIAEKALPPEAFIEKTELPERYIPGYTSNTGLTAPCIINTEYLEEYLEREESAFH